MKTDENMASEGVFVEEVNAEKLVGQNDLRKLKDLHFTSGIREGIIAGKESALQDGFNCGYKEAFCQSHNYGKLRGVLSAVLSYVSSSDEHEKSSQECCESIKTLLSQLSDAEGKRIKEIKTRLKDGKMTQENARFCSCVGDTLDTEEKPKGCSQNSELTEIWDRCKHLCNEIGIDFKKIAKLT